MYRLNSLAALMVDQLKELYSAETQLMRALPELAEAATDEDLKSGFLDHLDETKRRVDRIERVMDLLGTEPTGRICKAMEGLLAEGREIIGEDADPAVKDAALIAAAQRVDHYEIAGYSSVRAYAETLAHVEVAEILQQTLAEVEDSDFHFAELAASITERAESGVGEPI